jgi:hypothetical protein
MLEAEAEVELLVLHHLEELVVAARKIQPEVEVVGTLSPPFRIWTEKDEQKFADEIRASQADFIWVALGGGRQEEWIAKNEDEYINKAITFSKDFNQLNKTRSYLRYNSRKSTLFDSKTFYKNFINSIYKVIN